MLKYFNKAEITVQTMELLIPVKRRRGNVDIMLEKSSFKLQNRKGARSRGGYCTTGSGNIATQPWIHRVAHIHGQPDSYKSDKQPAPNPGKQSSKTS